MSQPPGTSLLKDVPGRAPRTNGARPGTPTAAGRSPASSAVYSGATLTPVATVRRSASSTGSGSSCRPALRSTPATSSRHSSRLAARNCPARTSSSGISCPPGPSASAGGRVCWSGDLIAGLPPLVDGTSEKSVPRGPRPCAGGARIGHQRVQDGPAEQPYADPDRPLVDVERAAVQVERGSPAMSAQPGERDGQDVGEPAEVLPTHA